MPFISAANAPMYFGDTRIVAVTAFQVAHVSADPGQSQQSAVFAQHLAHLYRRQVFLLHEIQHSKHVQVAVPVIVQDTCLG